MMAIIPRDKQQISGGAWVRTAWPARSKQNPFTEHFMHRMTGFAALLASVLVAVAPLAVAVAQQAKPPANAPVNAAGNPAPVDPKEALAAFAKAKVTLTDAVAAGEQQGGGKAVDATFGGGAANPAFRVTIYRNKTLWEGLFDANTGKPIGQANT